MRSQLIVKNSLLAMPVDTQFCIWVLSFFSSPQYDNEGRTISDSLSEQICRMWGELGRGWVFCPNFLSVCVNILHLNCKVTGRFLLPNSSNYSTLYSTDISWSQSCLWLRCDSVSDWRAICTLIYLYQLISMYLVFRTHILQLNNLIVRTLKITD